MQQVFAMLRKIGRKQISRQSGFEIGLCCTRYYIYEESFWRIGKHMETTELMYDVIVIGAGPAGMTCLVCISIQFICIVNRTRAPGGQLNNTAEIETISK